MVAKLISNGSEIN